MMDEMVTLGLRELIHKSNAGHVKVQVFVGRNAGSRGNSGELTIRRDEWEALQAEIEEDLFGIAAYLDLLDPLDLPGSIEVTIHHPQRCPACGEVLHG
jgi:hypothetical protein